MDRPEGVEELPEFAGVSEELQVFAETLDPAVLWFDLRLRDFVLVWRCVVTYPFAGTDCHA